MQISLFLVLSLCVSASSAFSPGALGSSALVPSTNSLVSSSPRSRLPAASCTGSRLWLSCSDQQLSHPPSQPSIPLEEEASEILSRRTVLGYLATSAGLLTGGRAEALGPLDLEKYQGSSPRVFVQRGMLRFKEGRVGESISDFDKAISLDSNQAGYLWQRGLSLYYADRFQDASEQFQRDVALNPRDTEEAVWDLVSRARAGGLSKAQEQVIEIKGESRPYMKIVYEVYAGKRPLKDLKEMTAKAEAFLSKPGNRNRDQAAQVEFYGNLYLGLLAEAAGTMEEAKTYLTKAATSQYKETGDYMWYLSKVHCSLRGWDCES